MKEKIVINGTETTLRDYGIGYHAKEQRKVRLEATKKTILVPVRVKHLWIDTARGRYVLSHIVNDEHIGKPIELTFTKSGGCKFITIDADQKETRRFAYQVEAPRKRAPGKRGAPRRDRVLVKKIMAVVKIEKAKGVRGHLARAADALRIDRQLVRKVSDAERKTSSRLNTAIPKRK